MSHESTKTIDRRARMDGDPVGKLSFVADRKKAGLPLGRFPRCFWHVAPTGDYAEDCRIGGRLGLEYLRWEQDHVDAGFAPILISIVMDMPRETTGIEVGFLQAVGYAAAAGVHYAEQVSAHFERIRRAA